jgi:hypothetical protein
MRLLSEDEGSHRKDLRQEIERSRAFVDTNKREGQKLLLMSVIQTVLILIFLAYSYFGSHLQTPWEPEVWLLIIFLSWTHYFRFKREFDLRLVIAKLAYEISRLAPQTPAVDQKTTL